LDNKSTKLSYEDKVDAELRGLIIKGCHNCKLVWTKSNKCKKCLDSGDKYSEWIHEDDN